MYIAAQPINQAHASLPSRFHLTRTLLLKNAHLFHAYCSHFVHSLPCSSDASQTNTPATPPALRIAYCSTDYLQPMPAVNLQSFVRKKTSIASHVHDTIIHISIHALVTNRPSVVPALELLSQPQRRPSASAPGPGARRLHCFSHIHCNATVLVALDVVMLCRLVFHCLMDERDKQIDGQTN